MQIDAHNGGVNDIAFASPKQLCVITCGDDHTIKIWDASSGRKQYTFEGHEAPVYSVCPHHKENIQVGDRVWGSWVTCRTLVVKNPIYSSTVPIEEIENAWACLKVSREFPLGV